MTTRTTVPVQGDDGKYRVEVRWTDSDGVVHRLLYVSRNLAYASLLLRRERGSTAYVLGQRTECGIEIREATARICPAWAVTCEQPGCDGERPTHPLTGAPLAAMQVVTERELVGVA